MCPVPGQHEDPDPIPACIHESTAARAPPVLRRPGALHSLNALLGLHGRPLVVPTAPAASGILAEPVGIGQMYNQVILVHLPAQADAVFFLPGVSPLRAC